MSDRLATTFATLQAAGKKAFVAYIAAGDFPHLPSKADAAAAGG